MRIEELQLFNFRNYEKELISFEGNINIITGGNGQGKTNLIEGIHILSLGKSFRTLNDAEMIRFGADFFRVRGVFEKGGDGLSVEMRFSGREKSFVIDGSEKKKNADLLEHVYTVIFSPEDLKIVREEPEKRRRFMDRELFQLKPLYYMELVKYRKALRNRNILLKEDRADEDMISVYDRYLAEAGAKIMWERGAFVEKLCRTSQDIERRLTGGKENLEVTYEANVDREETQERQRDRIEKELTRNRERDIARCGTTAGPHRDDLKITANGVDLRHFGSGGQQRTAALSLKLAELKIIREETGEEAILLLDDVLSELDEERQDYLFCSFEQNQLFITAAEVNESMRKALPKGKLYRVSEGKVE